MKILLALSTVLMLFILAACDSSSVNSNAQQRSFPAGPDDASIKVAASRTASNVAAITVQSDVQARNIKLSWAPVKTATSYQLRYQRIDGGSRQEVLLDFPSFLIVAAENESYSVEIAALNDNDVVVARTSGNFQVSNHAAAQNDSAK